jgi:hypothetical protein
MFLSFLLKDRDRIGLIISYYVSSRKWAISKENAPMTVLNRCHIKFKTLPVCCQMALSPEQKIMFEVVGDFRASTTDGMSSYVCITLSGVAVYEPPRVATNIQVNLHFIPLQLLNYSIID